MRGAIAAAVSAAWLFAAAPAEVELERGSDLVEKGQHADAVPVLARAYRALEPEQQRGELGRYIVGLASQASRNAGTASAEAEELSLLEEYVAVLDDARGKGEATLAADAEEAALRERLRSLVAARETVPPPPPAAPLAPDDRAASSTDAPTHGSDRARPRDAIGIGLVTTGAVLTAGGIGMLAVGLRFPALIEEAEDDARTRYGVAEGESPPNWEEHARSEQRKGHALLGVGIAVAVVGVGLLSYGAYRLAAARRRTAARLPVRFDARGIVLTLPAI